MLKILLLNTVLSTERLLTKGETNMSDAASEKLHSDALYLNRDVRNGMKLSSQHSTNVFMLNVCCKSASRFESLNH